MNTQTLTIVTTTTTFPTIHIMTLNSLIVTKSIKSFLNLILLIGHFPPLVVQQNIFGCS